MSKSEHKELSKAIELLRQIRAQNYVTDAAYDDAGTRRWIKNTDALLDRMDSKL